MSKLSVATDLALQGPDFPMSADTIENILLAGIVSAVAGSSAGGVGTVVPVLRAVGTQTESTIATGGVAQSADAANTSRSAFAIQNTDADDNLHVSLDGTVASAASFLLAPGQTLNVRELGVIPTGAISVFGATTGQSYCLFTA